MTNQLNDFFPQICNWKKNSELMYEVISNQDVRNAVISRLVMVQNSEDATLRWWQDHDLMCLFRDFYIAEIVDLPNNAVHRFRWIATICMEICKLENVDYTSFISPYDYLPVDKFGNVKHADPVLLKERSEFRNILETVGWNNVFGW